MITDHFLFIGQTAPDYAVCLLPEYWRFRHGQPWQSHFVTVAKIVFGKVMHAYVPILPAEYRSNPTLWPRGTVGTGFYFSEISLIFNHLK